MRSIWLLLTGVLLWVGTAASASAQYRGVPARWAERPLTLPRQTLRLDLAPPDYTLLDSGVIGEGYGLRISDVDGDPDEDLLVRHGVGLAYGITSTVELGGKLVPLRYHPNPDYLDLELYLRWAFVRTRSADMGLQFAMQLPTDDPRVFGMGFGMPIRIRMGEVGRLDLGIELELLFWDFDNDGDLDVDANLDIPIALSFSVTERFYLGGQLGLFIGEFDIIGVRGGGHIGYTVGKRRRKVDFTGSFDFYGGDRYHYGYRRGGIYLGGTRRRWEVTAGLRAYFGL